MTTRVFAAPGELLDAIGESFGPGPWRRVNQETINAFGDLTGDRQWIHVDPARAADGPFGGPIAHGYLLVGLLTPLLDDIVVVRGVDAAVNRGVDRLRFRAPVPAGHFVRGTAVLDSANSVSGGYVAATLEVTVEVSPSDDAEEGAAALTVQCRPLYRESAAVQRSVSVIL